MSPYLLPDGNVAIQFSGGRSSGFMLHQILEANGGLPARAQVVFSNTGREMPQTLDFVAEVGRRWGVPIMWLEYHPLFVYLEVDRAAASQNGEPFEALIRSKKYLPNQRFRFCTADLKVRPVKNYLIDQGWGNWHSAVGIRADEAHRAKPSPKERWTRWHPMVTAGVTKESVVAWWARQPFDLELPSLGGKTPLGNCDGCFLKSEWNLTALCTMAPERHAWWERMEALAGELSSNPSGATFSKRYSRRDLRARFEAMGPAVMSTEGALCAASDGECTDDE